MITEHNLEEHYNENDSIVFKNSTYFVKSDINTWHLHVISTNEENKINNKLFKFKDREYFKQKISQMANDIIESQDKTYIDEDVISFITKCSHGTGHGYVDIFLSTICYVQNIDKCKNHKILVYENSSKGILDIINHLCHMNIIDKNKIIYIKEGIIYKFRSICNHVDFYPGKIKNKSNKFYTYEDNFFNNVKLFINKYFTNKIDYLGQINYHIENVAIIKEDLPQLCVGNQMGKVSGFNKNDINLFCKKNNLTLVRPENINEVTLINILNNCKKFVVTLGTSSHKNIVYLSEICKSINIIIQKGSKYEKEHRKEYLSDYNKYLKFGSRRNECLKNFYDPPRVKYLTVNNLEEIVL